MTPLALTAPASAVAVALTLVSLPPEPARALPERPAEILTPQVLAPNCRLIRHTVTLDGKAQTETLLACYNPDIGWHYVTTSEDELPLQRTAP